MPAPFQRLSIAEFAELVARFPFTRRVTEVHMHHTWRPNHAQFRGHDSIVAMWRFHTQEREFADIAQHVTIDPEGFVWTGRDWNLPPASAKGFNGNAQNGPFMFEIIGDFDRGMDPFGGQQRVAVLDVIRLVQAKFDLQPDQLRFHNEMSTKSCPGTSIDQRAFLQAVRGHTPSATASGARGTSPGPFAPSYLAINDAVGSAIALLTQGGGARGVDSADAELHYGDDARDVGFAGNAARGADDRLGSDDLEALRPHVVNLRMGKFSSDGLMTTTQGDVDALFDTHLARWVGANDANERPSRVVFYAHGGLTAESGALEWARRTCRWWLDNGVYPIYFVWETGLFETLADLILKAHGRATAGARDLADWTSDPILEELGRALQAVRIWGAMKASAALASADDGGAHYVATRLRQFMKDHAGKVELHGVGHSAGSIFQCHFLPACAGMGIGFKSLQFLAPAITCDDFKKYRARMSTVQVPQPFTTMYTMNRTLERADNCANAYRKSLLYLVSEACEPERKTPILGMEEFLRKDPALQALFGLGKSSTNGEVVWSKSILDSGRSASRSTSHGGFDDDAPTMGSVVRRICELQDATPIRPFPPAPANRGVSRDWTAEVDWPEPFDRAPLVAPKPPTASLAPTKSGTAVWTGNRRAVCFGINQYPTAPLGGCVKDAQDWYNTLTSLGFNAGKGPIPELQSTRARMVAELSALIAGSRSGDMLVFQYSGHGTQVDDLNGDEASGDSPGLDEALCPIDFDDGHFLIDDDIAEQIALLPQGVQLTFLLDCCHSGTGTRFAARTQSSGLPTGSVARYVVPSSAQLQRHKSFRGQASPDGTGRALAGAPAAIGMREVAFTACRSKEVAWESGGQGEFTRRAHAVLANGAHGLTNSGFLEAILKAFGSNARQHPQLDCDVALRDARWLDL